PAFGIFSEIISTFSRRNLYGYTSMVWSMILISVFSFFVWTHHFFTMGQGALTNSIFSITTMAVGIPTGVKIFNWLFTMYKGKIVMTTPMLYAMHFIPLFTLGGVTGVMLGMASADYQYHNTMFLVAHFHNVIIPGVVYAMLGGLTFYWPKMFGFMLNEKIGKATVWVLSFGFVLAFLPMYITGLDGQARRMYTYSEASGFAFWNMVTFIGAGIMAVGVLMLVWNIYYSFKNAPRDISQDPWDARGLEWATHTPIPVYNFAITPDVTNASEQAFWDAKKNGVNLFKGKLEDIHMPSNDGGPFVLSVFFLIGGFCLIFSMFIPAIISLIGILGCLVYRSFQIDDGYHIHVDEIEEIESKFKQGGAK
ncbi:MAG: cbb3-type cytochrome c oxidase subunit I, partial [Lysinibacillus sp.]